jgi:hypothetical protein
VGGSCGIGSRRDVIVPLIIAFGLIFFLICRVKLPETFFIRMKRLLFTLPLLMLLFACCKSNEKAYNVAYQNLKEKNEESLLAQRANTAETISDDVVKKAPGMVKVHETVTLILGKQEDLSTYNIVIKSFINRTNAKSLFDRMVDDGHKAVLVQNKESMFRIIISACKYEKDADNMLAEARKEWPEAWILVRY